VVGVPHQIYGEEIVAFITLRNNQKLEAEEVRQFCREHLADFKVPREVFFIEELPKGPAARCNGDVCEMFIIISQHNRRRKSHHENDNQGMGDNRNCGTDIRNRRRPTLAAKKPADTGVIKIGTNRALGTVTPYVGQVRGIFAKQG